jgi:hypothetical protein
MKLSSFLENPRKLCGFLCVEKGSAISPFSVPIAERAIFDVPYRDCQYLMCNVFHFIYLNASPLSP